MARVIKRIDYNSRAISFTGTAIFASMGKYVTDFMTRFKGDGFTVTPLTEDDFLERDEPSPSALAIGLWVSALDCEEPGLVELRASDTLRSTLEGAGFSPEAAHAIARAPELLDQARTLLTSGRRE